MKKLALTFVAVVISASIFSQNNDVKIKMCEEQPSNILLKRDLLNCKLIKVNNKDYSIYSLTIGFVHDDDYIEMKSFDGKIENFIKEKISKNNPEVIYVENIILKDKEGNLKTIENQKYFIN